MLQEYIAPGVSKEEFTRRLKKVLEPAQTAAPAAPQPQSSSSPQPQHAPEAQPTREPEPVPELPQSQPTPSPAPSANQSTPAEPSASSASATTTTPSSLTPSSTTNDRVAALLAERAARLAADKKRQDEQEKKRRAEAARAQRAGQGSTPGAARHLEEIRRQREQAREERQRILERIEHDREERRRVREENEKRKREMREGGEVREVGEMSSAGEKPKRGAENCALQVRLFDGSTIRSRFPSSVTLREVREWVDQEARGSAGSGGKYLFKVLLTPLPSRTIPSEEEGQTLLELGLAPSSTLILVRAPRSQGAGVTARATGAAEGGVAEGNIFQRFIVAIIGVVLGVWNGIVAFFSSLFSTQGVPQQPENAAPAQERESAGRTSQREEATAVVRKRTGGPIVGLDQLREEGRGDQQYYNGNSVSYPPHILQMGCKARVNIYMIQTNFEPRHDEDGE